MFLIRKVAYIDCSFYSEELGEHFWRVGITSLQGLIDVIVRLRKDIAEEFSYVHCNYVRIILSKLEKGDLGEISVEVRRARTRGDLAL